MRSIVRVLACVTLVASSACAAATTPEDERDDLCGDLANLRATVDLLVAPPPGTTVGEIRGALEKLVPTTSALGESTLVTDRDLRDLVRSQETYRSAIERVSDDEQLIAVLAQIGASSRRLGMGYETVVETLDC
jgi:hypothetical protein